MIPTFTVPESLHYIVEHHKAFIEKVCATELVYTLKNEEGYVSSACNLMEDDEGVPYDKMCFWSDKALAESCMVAEWQDCRVDMIPLSTFIESWCIGMSSEGLIAGTEASAEGIGFEIDPLELILELATQLEHTGKSIQLEKFKDINELVQQIKEILS